MSISASIKATGKSLDSMKDLLVEELKDLYDVEDQILDALPKMADAASSERVKQAFREHLETTKRQKTRLEEVFRRINIEPERGKCDGIRGIISEGEVLMKAKGKAEVKDAALVSAAQRVEHYEIAGYGAARSFAKNLGLNDVAGILQQTLDEEGKADRWLTQLAVSHINPQAMI